MEDDYESFVEQKARTRSTRSVDALECGISTMLFPHQRDLVSWAMRRGRAAIFADTGLGKTAMLLEWAKHVSANGRVIILTPLAVAEQIVREGVKFGVECAYLRKDDGSTRIVVTNYEMVAHFDPANFCGVVIDESSILKSYDGKTRTQIIESFASTEWRLACTATPAPNDHTELGNHAEFLGIKSRVEMLAEFFVHDGGDTSEWRLKGHAKSVFWRWVASWGAVVKRPSDIGHSDDGFELPPLRMHERVISVDHSDAKNHGALFFDEARTLSDQRVSRKSTISERVSIAKEISSEPGPCLIWCEFNDEADEITRAIQGAVQVRGSDSPEVKADRLLGFADGRYRVLVTKPSIAGFGLNWQHCSRMVFAGVSHSYEQTYQAVRRCWRFGQTRPVDVHIIRSELDGQILANLRRKESDAERMTDAMASQMRDVMRSEISTATREINEYAPSTKMVVPEWMESER